MCYIFCCGPSNSAHGAGTILIGLRKLLLGCDLLMLGVKQSVLQSGPFRSLRCTDYGAVLFGRWLWRKIAMNWVANRPAISWETLPTY